VSSEDKFAGAAVRRLGEAPLALDEDEVQAVLAERRKKDWVAGVVRMLLIPQDRAPTPVALMLEAAARDETGLHFRVSEAEGGTVNVVADFHDGGSRLGPCVVTLVLSRKLLETLRPAYEATLRGGGR
jgi:hypothetical protein